jgi:hypothetical protein
MSDQEREPSLAELIDRLDESGLALAYRPGDLIIPLTKNKVTIVDMEDEPVVRSFRWHAHPARQAYYAAHVQKVFCKIRKRKISKTTYLHRLLTGLDYGGNVHHKDGRTLNNCKRNLVIVTPSENMSARRFENSTGFHGIRQHGLKFQARITVRRRRVHLGMFDTAEAAARAVDDALVAMIGPGCELNFPKVPQVESEVPF